MSSPRRWTVGAGAPLWSCPPRPPKVPKYDRLPVTNRRGETVIVVSCKLEETRTHYVDGRTQPCTGDEGKCWIDHRLVGSPRYGAWLAVHREGKDKVYLLSLTLVSVAVEPRLRDATLDLRGLKLKVWRLHDHERSELHARLLLDEPRAVDTPHCPDVRFAIVRMLEADDRPKGPAWAKPGPIQRAYQALKGGAQ